MKIPTSENSKENLKKSTFSSSYSVIKKRNENIKIIKANSNIPNLFKYYNLTKNNSFDKNSKKNILSRNSCKNNLDNIKFNSHSNQLLSKNDKKIITSIIKDFNKNKIVTKRLLKNEEFLALNSVSNANYNSLLRKNERKQNKKRSTLLLYRNLYEDISSSMINQFNNRTFDILVKPNNSHMYSTNLNYFRQQLINNFTENNENNNEYNRKKYNEAMKIGEINDKRNLKLAFELEKSFYQNKYKNAFITDINIIINININQYLKRKNIIENLF